MGLTKQYLRYVHKASFGVVTSRKGEAIIVHSVKHGTTVASPALEDVILWDLRKGEKIAVLRGGQHEVSSLALSPDKSGILAVGYEDGSIRLWSLTTHECVVTLSGHKSGVTCLIYDHTGTHLVSGSKDTDIIVWDVVNESGLCRLKGHKGPITACKLMKRYNILISSSKDTFVKLWDLNTYHCFQTLVGHKSEVWSLELLDEEQRLVTGCSNKDLRVFAIKDTESYSEVTRSTAGEKRKTSVPEEDKAGPVVCSDIGSLKRTSTEKAVQLKSDASQSFLFCLGADSCLEVWRVRSEQEREKLRKKRAKKLQKKLKRTGEEANEDDEEGVTLSISDELPAVTTHTFKTKVRSFDVMIKPSGELQLLMALQNNSLELYSFLSSSKPPSFTHTLSLTAQGHRNDVRTVCFSSDDSCLLSASSNLVKIWSRETQQCTHTIPSGYALCSTFAPGDRHVIIGTKAGELQLFDIAAGTQLETVEAHQGAVWSISMTADKRGFATGSADHQVKFWEFELVSDESGQSKKRLSVAHTKTMKMSDDVLGVKYSPDQRLLAVALLDSTVKVFFADSLKFFLSLYGHKLPVLSMDISSDSTLLVTSSADKNIKIWGLDYGDCHKSIFAHDDSIMCIQFVPKTHLVFSGSKDKTIKCWNADNFEHVLTLEGHQAEVWCLAVSNDGDSVVSGSHDFSLRLWERTQEPLILSEQKEMEREAQFEAALAEGGEPVIPGENVSQEVQMAGKKTMETMKAAERIMEALEVFREEKGKQDLYLEECKIAGKQLPPPHPSPIIVALGNPQPERYVLDVVKKVHSSELEESLLVMPFGYVTDLLRLLSAWLQKGWEVELSLRCLLFLLRVHHQQIVSDQGLLHVIDTLRDHSMSQVDTLKDLCGFNLAGLQHLQRQLDEAGIKVFGDTTEQLKRIRNRKKKRIDVTV